MTLPKLCAFSNVEILDRMKQFKGTEDRGTADAVLCLHEIDTRGIFRDAGYSSLFTYCCSCLGYSEGSAHRRIRAARCLQDSPEIYLLLAEGKLTLSALSEVSTVMTGENRETVLSMTQGASKREAEKIAVQFGAVERPKRESIRLYRVQLKPAPADLFTAAAARSASPEKPAAPQVEERLSFSFDVSKEGAALYEQVKAMIGACSAAEVFERVLRDYLSRRQPREVRERTSPEKVETVVKTVSAKAGTRGVTSAVRREVFQRDSEQCTYVSPDGVRCSEHHRLEVDHIQPVARGGSNEIDNLRLLCRSHNQLLAEQWFGREFMIEKRRTGAAQ